MQAESRLVAGDTKRYSHAYTTVIALRYHAAMRLRRSLRKFEQDVEEAAGISPRGSRVVLRNIGWVSAGVTVLAVGLVVGRELRQRYKFNRRTPYDVYAHAGDEMQDVEFSVGV
jgi:hypothetical protein